MCYAPSMVMVGYYFKRRLGLANALAVGGSSIGQFIFPPFVTFLLDRYSLSGTLLILAGVMFNLTLGGALLRPVTFYDKKSSTDGQRVGISSSSSSASSEGREDDNFRERTPSSGTEAIEAPAKPLIKHSAPSQDEKLIPSVYIELVKDECNGANKLVSDDSPPDANLYVQTRHYDDDFVDSAECSTEAVQNDILLHSDGGFHCSTLTSEIMIMKTKPNNGRRICSLFTASLCDLSLLRNPVYVMFALGCCAGSFSFIGFFRYLPAHCKDIGIEQDQRALLLSVIGAADLISRLSVGFVADTKFVRQRLERYRLLALSLVLSGVNGLFIAHCKSFVSILVACILYGVFGGVHMTMLSVALVDLLGAGSLSRAWGIMLLLYSSTTVGEPLVLGE